MSSINNTQPNQNGNSNKWTVMFYFAADNQLSPLIVSQIKAIKDAGYQANTDVLVHFDPSERGEPTRLFHINEGRKYQDRKAGKRATDIGDGTNTFVRNFADDDNVLPDSIQVVDSKTEAKPFSLAMQKSLIERDKSGAPDALRNFIGYCMENHSADHYILFLVGHGMIVGNDAFLPDDNPRSAITLSDLKDILETFEPNKLELLALHSCSMSSVEVAYQLKDKAKYMMASQGSSFVGSWSYRQLLKKIFNSIEAAGAGVDIKKLVEKLYYHALFSSTDFMSAGYSSDTCLCNLTADKVNTLTTPLQNLVRILKYGLANDTPLKELIVWAHWESQSYWEEFYTDLSDFCRCLKTRCTKMFGIYDSAVLDEGGKATEEFEKTKKELTDVITACTDVIDALETVRNKEDSTAARDQRFARLVIQSAHFGSRYQYSHGLSVYFPWTEPLDLEPLANVAEAKTIGEPDSAKRGTNGKSSRERSQRIMENYKQYDFTKELGEDSWFSFLNDYFKHTKRLSRDEEDVAQDGGNPSMRVNSSVDMHANSPFAARASEVFNPAGALQKANAEYGVNGATCSCPTIKNYPTETIKGKKVQRFSISRDAEQVFNGEREETYR